MKMKRTGQKIVTTSTRIPPTPAHPIPFNNEIVDISDYVSRHTRVRFGELEVVIIVVPRQVHRQHEKWNH
jgi:hypothetical protein